MQQVALTPTMGKKTKYIHIRADDDLKAALGRAAAKDVRSEADEARYLLLKALGLLAAEEQEPYSLIHDKPLKKTRSQGRA